MPHFAIAGLQLELSAQDNLAAIADEIEKLKKRFPWIDMMVLGELCSFGAAPGRAQPLPGPAENFYCALARRLGIWLVPGTLYEQCGDKIYNTAPVIDPQGAVVARYRKLFPFLPYEQSVAPGDAFVVFDVPQVGRFGVSICYDMWFPEVSRQLAWLGAEVIIHPTMTNTIDRELELAIARTNAASNQCYFIDINVAGQLGNGRSIIVGPDGNVLYQAGGTRELIPVELDLAHLRRSRERGLLGLGQPLKSFRDSAVELPVYAPGQRASEPLRRLGPVTLPPPARRGEDTE